MTNGEINRLGTRIVKAEGVLSSKDLSMLQEFRTSFSKPLTNTFNEVISIKNNIRQSAIVAFRLKRIGTIINKVIRKPDMNLSRMGDIAGIRMMFENDREVYRALEFIQSQFEQSGKVRDYIKYPKKIGYKGVHIYVKDKTSGKRIEIQIRTTAHHNWATLVEISDLLYDTRLKELGYESNPKFAEFHALMSSDKELTDEEADLVFEMLEERDYITRLSKLFRRNFSEVKKQWGALGKKSKYFLIEASKNQTPILKAFVNYEDAEREYFETYKRSQHAEIVLTAISKPSFHQLCIAYANYVLSYHVFIKDVEPIIKNLALRALEENNIRKFKKIFSTYESLQASLLLDAVFEVIELYGVKFDNGKIVLQFNKAITKSKERILKNRLNKSIKERANSFSSFLMEINQNMPSGFFKKQRCNAFLKKHKKRLENDIKKQTLHIVIETNQ